jgi:dolichol-phosphate mannosyltransferase
VSVIIPTYNEAANIVRVVDRCLSAISGYRCEVIVVDDNSPDGTWRLVEEQYAGDDRVRVVRRTGDRGLATAVSRGFREASNEYCAVIDADLQHPPEKLPELIEALDSDPAVDVAIGSRHIANGGIENWSRARRIVSRGATVLARLGIPRVRSVSDPLSGFFAVRRSVIDDVALDPTGYKILLEILARCDCNRVAEVPYVFREREYGDSKLDGGEYVNFLKHILKLRLQSIVDSL